MELRPLGFGEIFDRAVTLYIRNFVPFVAIVLVLVVPTAIMQYFLDLNSGSQLTQMLQIFRHAGRGGNGTQLPFYNAEGGLVPLLATLFLTYAIWPFALNAVAVGVARLYRGRRVEFRACYERVLRRWPSIFGLLGVELVVLLLWYLAAIAASVLLFLVFGIFIAAAPKVLSLIFALLIAAIILGLLLPSLLVLILAMNFAMYSCVIEDTGVGASVSAGFSRVFNRTEFWRALLVAIATSAMAFMASLLFGAFGMFFSLVHLPVLQTIVQSLPQAVVTPFTVVVLAIYYFDVRIRREAFDLEAGLERLTAAQPA
ncbi:MAG: hypothetical protein JO030_09070 [Candidatus Eremiobacteraeota bacterium]|nr:hypothetical protein [Candidatus Eremiobacteraeota bacterium]